MKFSRPSSTLHLFHQRRALCMPLTCRITPVSPGPPLPLIRHHLYRLDILILPSLAIDTVPYRLLTGSKDQAEQEAKTQPDGRGTNMKPCATETQKPCAFAGRYDSGHKSSLQEDWHRMTSTFTSWQPPPRLMVTVSAIYNWNPFACMCTVRTFRAASVRSAKRNDRGKCTGKHTGSAFPILHSAVLHVLLDHSITRY